jgi:hypothetical protein
VGLWGIVEIGREFALLPALVFAIRSGAKPLFLTAGNVLEIDSSRQAKAAPATQTKSGHFNLMPPRCIKTFRPISGGF